MNVLSSWLARALFGAAQGLMPRGRGEWARAMRAEAHHVSEDERLQWALGCFWTAIKLRFDPMNTGDFRVSRWVMFVEVVGGFGPLALAWWEVTFGASGVIRLNGEIVQKYFLSYPGGAYMLVMMFVGSLAGLVGVTGLLLGLRYVATGRALVNRAFGWTLITILVAAHVFGLIVGVVAGPPDFDVNAFTFWFYTVMLTLVPVAVVYHLMVLARPVRPGTGPAVLV
jgi:hypothetical protein